MVTSAAGYENMSDFINGSDLGLVPVIFMVMSLSIITAAVLNVFIGKSYQKGVTKFKSKSGASGTLIMSYFTLAMIMVLSVSQLFKGAVSVIVFILSFLISLLLIKIADKFKLSWMKEFVLAFALIISMVLSVFIEKALL